MEETFRDLFDKVKSICKKGNNDHRYYDIILEKKVFRILLHHNNEINICLKVRGRYKCICLLYLNKDTFEFYHPSRYDYTNNSFITKQMITMIPLDVNLNKINWEKANKIYGDILKRFIEYIMNM